MGWHRYLNILLAKTAAKMTKTTVAMCPTQLAYLLLPGVVQTIRPLAVQSAGKLQCKYTFYTHICARYVIDLKYLETFQILFASPQLQKTSGIAQY